MTLHVTPAVVALLAAFGLVPAGAARAQATPTLPPVTVVDTAEGGGMGAGTFYMVVSVNGEATRTTALDETRRASAGRGAYIVTRPASRTVPAGPVTLGLRGVQTAIAPIDNLFRALFKGGDPVVEGAVSVDLRAGTSYRVTGAVDALRREVWIEDETGALVPGSKVTGAADPDMLKQMDGASYVGTNLRYSGDWINEVPYLGYGVVPIGSRIKVVEWGSNRATVLIDGRKMRVGVDFTRDQETIQQLMTRITTADDPRQRLSHLPPRVRDAIAAARVLPGMTKEQVLMALGRPRLDMTASLDAAEWLYPGVDNDEVYLVFGEGGVLKDVDGARKSRRAVLFDAP